MTAPSAAADVPTFRALIGQRAYVLMWSARLMGNLATQIQSIAIAWQVYAVARLTGTVAQGALAVGMIGLAQFLPMFLFALISGQVADRHDRRLIMAACMVVELASAGALCALAYTHFPALWPIYLIAVAFGAARAFYQPSSSALGPTLVPRHLAAARHRHEFLVLAAGFGRGAGDRRPAGGRFGDAGVRRGGGLVRPVDPAAVLFRLAGSELEGRRLAPGADPRRPALRVDQPLRPRPSRSTCSPSCSAAPPPCCRSSPATCCTPARRASACSALRPRLAG